MNIGKSVIVLMSLLLLTACSSLNPRTENQQTLLDTKLRHLLAAYNTRHGTHIQLPRITVADQPDQPSMIASTDYATWSISVNPAWIRKNPCLVYHEAMAHELAHLIADYLQYGKPRSAILMSRNGPFTVAFNGPPALQDPGDEHGKLWQTLAFELGANPCKEGYCYDPQPYWKTPLQCPANDVAWALDAAPK